MRKNLKRTLLSLTDDRAYVHFDGSLYLITEAGMLEVERNRLYEMPA